MSVREYSASSFCRNLSTRLPMSASAGLIVFSFVFFCAIFRESGSEVSFAYKFVYNRREQDDGYAHGDETIRDIERGPARHYKVREIAVDEIHHVSPVHPVDEIAERAHDDHRYSEASEPVVFFQGAVEQAENYKRDDRKDQEENRRRKERENVLRAAAERSAFVIREAEAEQIPRYADDTARRVFETRRKGAHRPALRKLIRGDAADDERHMKLERS